MQDGWCIDAGQSSGRRPSGNATLTYRHLYDSAAWRGYKRGGKLTGGLRLQALTADGYQCRTCKALCGGGPNTDTAPIVDHIIPHRGDPVLFYDPDNLQCLCLVCHNRKTAGEERRGYSGEFGADGLPADPRHHFHTGHTARQWGYSIPRGVEPSGVPVVLVCGAPASGKSTYVEAHAEPGDVVIDFDLIREKVGGTKWDQRMSIRRRALSYRAKMIYGLKDRRSGKCWLIVMAASKAERDAWCSALGDVDVELMDTSKAECLRRIKADPARRQHAFRHAGVVEDWFRQKAKAPR